MTSVRTWSGPEYDRLSTPMEAMGLAALERLELRGDETVLDAGCGSGRVTEALVARLPRGRVIGIDASASMIAAARARLGARADLRVADLATLELDERRGRRPLDRDVPLDRRPRSRSSPRCGRALRDGGRLVAQCGGRGNIAAVHAAAEATIAERALRCALRGVDAPVALRGP